MDKKKLIVTGGAGFIGSEFVRQAVKRGYKVIVIDNLSYAGDLARFDVVKSRIAFCKADICNKTKMMGIFKKEKPSAVIHFAAESHVDRSILGADAFLRTNIIGTQVLLDAARKYEANKFVYISTDEVYGEIEQGQFYEYSTIKPNSPYSVSKAAADLLVQSYIRTYGFPAIIVRPSNNYGPWQYPEKFIPLIIYKALKNEKIPVYGKGLNVREWLYVFDCVSAIFAVLEKGRIGEIYNIGSGNERKNIEVVKTILAYLNKPESLIEFVKDRLGHDTRYSLNSDKIKTELSWMQKTNFEEGIKNTLEWHKSNKEWLQQKARYLTKYWLRVYK
ncbi:MAG: dTDP-glucose 4,6-dehydratase [Omnitrophica WOR_2 bacterium RBG_13_41_10]|nr:MAG: dTDP-glucose 4,6-dehydratase [Omnitrophica WOR_2 bacterium RBG_13_41_10]